LAVLGVLGGAGNSSCFAPPAGAGGARKPAGAGFQVNSPALKNSAAGNPYFLCQAKRTPPPQKYALAKNSKGRRTALKKPKLPIIAIIGSFPQYFYLNCF